MYRLKFLSTTRYPTGNEDLDKMALNSIPWRHHDKMLKEMQEKGVINRLTTAVLLEGKIIPKKGWFEGGEIASATVVRYFEDPDVPVLGQKFAVEKLIKDGKFDRKQRTEIWKEFWRYSPKTESLRHGAYKDEIIYIKKGDWWRRLIKL